MSNYDLIHGWWPIYVPVFKRRHQLHGVSDVTRSHTTGFSESDAPTYVTNVSGGSTVEHDLMHIIWPKLSSYCQTMTSVRRISLTSFCHQLSMLLMQLRTSLCGFHALTDTSHFLIDVVTRQWHFQCKQLGLRMWQPAVMPHPNSPNWDAAWTGFGD